MRNFAATLEGVSQCDWVCTATGSIMAHSKGDKAMKLFQCMVPGCDWHTRNINEAEIIRRVSEHLRETHGEETIRESTIEIMKARIETERVAA
jgi:predicted small metal-binding protein